MIAIDALLREPTRVGEVPLDSIPGLMHAIRAEEGRLAALRDALVARVLEAGSGGGDGKGERLIGIDEAAERLDTTPDWLRRNAGTLPFTVRLSPGQVRFAVRGLDRWIGARMGR